MCLMYLFVYRNVVFSVRRLCTKVHQYIIYTCIYATSLYMLGSPLWINLAGENSNNRLSLPPIGKTMDFGPLLDWTMTSGGIYIYIVMNMFVQLEDELQSSSLVISDILCHHDWMVLSPHEPFLRKVTRKMILPCHVRLRQAAYAIAVARNDCRGPAFFWLRLAAEPHGHYDQLCTPLNTCIEVDYGTWNATQFPYICIPFGSQSLFQKSGMSSTSSV